jgi:hypothetical protein
VDCHGLLEKSIDSPWSPPTYYLNIFIFILNKKKMFTSRVKPSTFCYRTKGMLTNYTNRPHHFGALHAIHSAMADPRETTTTAATRNPSLTTTTTSDDNDNDPQQQQHQ